MVTTSLLRILITGAGRAIGYASAVELADRGHEVIATARNIEQMEPHRNVTFCRLDVTDRASIAECLQQSGPIDAVVNNAAVGGAGPLEDFPIERIRAMFETNMIGALNLTQAVVPAWRERGSGVIVNVSSVSGQISSPLEGPYSATKFALEALSESLHYELGELWRQWDGTDDRVTGGQGRTSSADAAVVIAEAIENPDTPLRVRIGDDAEQVLGTRRRMSDEDFEAAMRGTLGLTW